MESALSPCYFVSFSFPGASTLGARNYMGSLLLIAHPLSSTSPLCLLCELSSFGEIVGS